MTSATTQPTDLVQPQPLATVDWIHILQNAARTPPDHPRYAEARQVAQVALDSIRGRHEAANLAEQQGLPQPGIPATIGVNFGQGASLGAASQIGDAMTPKNLVLGLPALAMGLLPGGLPAAGSLLKAGSNTQNSDYLAATREAHPFVAGASDVLGGAGTATLALPLVAGLGPGTGGAILGGGAGAIRGGVEPIPGFTRAESAALGGVGGAITGALLGKFVSRMGKVFSTLARNARGLLGAKAAPADVAVATEQAIRAQLTKFKVAPDLIERAVQSWKTTGQLSVENLAAPKPPPVPISIRPGETITTIPKPPPDPLNTPTFMRRGTLSPQIGGGGFALPGSPEAVPPQAVTDIAPPMTQPVIDPRNAARNAYNLVQGLGGTDPTAAARGAAGMATNAGNFDPRQALLLALLLGGNRSGGRP